MTIITQDTDISTYYPLCGFPIPTSNDLEAWNDLDVDAGTAATLSLGLFGYDITCLASHCSRVLDYYGYCDMIIAKGFDGLAFGAHSVSDSSATPTEAT